VYTLIREGQSTPVDLRMNVSIPASVLMDGEAEFTFWIHNLGTQMAENVDVKISFGPGLQPIMTKGGSASLTNDGMVIFETIPSIAYGRGASLAVVAKGTRVGNQQIRMEVICKNADVRLMNEQTIAVVPQPLPNVHAVPGARLVEKQIGPGPISVRIPRGDMNETFTLTMHVTVREREQWRFDAEYERRMHQIIASVENVMRAATSEERTEVGHAGIRERSRRVINDVLGTPFVNDVFLTNVTSVKTKNVY